MSLKGKAKVLTMAYNSPTTRCLHHHLRPHLLVPSTRIISFLLCCIRTFALALPFVWSNLVSNIYMACSLIFFKTCVLMSTKFFNFLLWNKLHKCLSSILFLSVSAMPRNACARMETQYLLKELSILLFAVEIISS